MREPLGPLRDLPDDIRVGGVDARDGDFRGEGEDVVSVVVNENAAARTVNADLNGHAQSVGQFGIALLLQLPKWDPDYPLRECNGVRAATSFLPRFALRRR